MARNCVLAACILQLLAIPVIANLAPHEQLATLPSGWRQAKTVPEANTSIHLSVAITLKNMDSLSPALKNVSTPGENNYGVYRDVDEILSHFGPAQASTDAVIAWLNESGINSVYNHNNFSIDFLTTVEQVTPIKNTEAKYRLIFTRPTVC